MSLGLLGALGGLGKGITQYGQTLFSEAIEEKREARLQAIRDKEYARSRADAVADRQVNQQFQRDLAQENRAFQTSEREARQGFQTSERASSQEFQSDQAELARDARLSGMQVDANGNVYVLEGGELKSKGSIDVSDNRVNNLLKAYTELNRSLISQAASRDDPMFSNDFARLDALTGQVMTSLEVDSSSPANIWERIKLNKFPPAQVEKFKAMYPDWYRENALGGN